ncbi:MAG TPA: helix-turn-helix domain-containing protein [Nitrososphaera sp.]|jgi:DNA-binding CsgD family transcriptional regulator|nr:helix-turn-helix domain-containing protein [Nitrososphaera sp.]
MRRITMEFNYEAAWKQIFGLNANRVEVLEALRCFKCDTQGLAIICRIKLKDNNNMNVQDLLRGKGLLTNIELLYKEKKDDSLVVFIEGGSCVPKPPKDIKPPKMLMARPPDFLDVDRMKVEMIGKENEIKKLLHYTNKWGDNSFKILGLTSVDTKEGGASLLSKLTRRQRQMLLTAYALGYYDVPRRISSDELSRHLKVDKSTIVEHLRKAERKLIGSIIAE